MNTIKENTESLLKELPAGVQLVVAGKDRTVEELMAAMEGGARFIGENYVQEAETAHTAIGNVVQWHFIGHLQKNKVKRAVELFDMIETVDSLELAREIDKRCASINKIMPVLIEVNSAREENKTGVLPENVTALAREIATLPHIRLMGLMTMGPTLSNPEEYRPYFALAKRLFDEIARLNLPNAEMKYLSMGMTDSYRMALQEGANVVRIGTGIFGKR
ncbi:MAG TPA: YggS family pyridoxal phosphate-dependent enzyme [Dehalococcoidales bacterium]